MKLTATELQTLISLCAKSNVTQLKAGSVCVTFSGFRLPQAAGPDPLAELANGAAQDRAWMDALPPPTEFSDVPPDEAE